MVLSSTGMRVRVRTGHANNEHTKKNPRLALTTKTVPALRMLLHEHQPSLPAAAATSEK